MALHAHLQIEYSKCPKDKTRHDLSRHRDYPAAMESVESLIGFDPTDKQGRDMAHKMLDEYLDYLEAFFKFRKESGFEKFKTYEEDAANRFIVFGHLDG